MSVRADESESVVHPQDVLTAAEIMGDARQQQFSALSGTKKQPAQMSPRIKLS